ncbi:PQQ-binding-like beta-propeller repeat protein [Rhodoblastus sp.]|uniref:pyrroloquinoline quinone-dependent dehydrogenase n=1 Tax=Rhodoblastus sp. TaxID=1962975 RepID=UPI00262FEC2F|nr:PQQ-binding-like beta-propeller repeat protein [Rhodoblastus sp.]
MAIYSNARLHLLALALIATVAPVGANAESVKDMGMASPNDWPQYHRTGAAWRYSPLDQVNRDNVKNLKVQWIAQPGDITQGLQATPIEVDGVLYYIGPYNHVYALDGVTGKMIWQYQPKLAPVSNESFYAAASRGVTVGRGKVFIGSLDGRFIALDQKTGKELWSRQLIDLKTNYGALFSSPPQLAGDILFGGSTGGDQPVRGKIFAVNADTGEPAWTFDTIKNDPKSWPGNSGDVGGGSVWLPGSYDETTDTIYIGTSNAAPDFYGADREGDNKYTASLLAIEPKNGKLKWARQEIPHDVWDYDSAYEALLLPTGDQKTLVHLNKSGFVFVMNKDNGELLNTWKLVDNLNTIKNIDPKTGELIDRNEAKPDQKVLFCPWLLGARSWNHGAYSPQTGFWYTNTMEACNYVVSQKDNPDNLKAINSLSLGAAQLQTVAPPIGKAMGRLVARDPITGAAKWSVDYDIPALGAVLATGGGLVFNTDVTGVIHAYDAENGKELWHFNAGSGSRGGPISYSINGKQYVAVPTGLGSVALGFMASAFPEVKKLPGGAALVVFALP